MERTDEQLEAELYKTCNVASRAGYNPTYFRRLLGESGGPGTVRRLLSTGEQQAQTGLQRLYELNLLGISAEAVMLKPDYVSLFDASERAVARARLAQYGYRPEWDMGH